MRSPLSSSTNSRPVAVDLAIAGLLVRLAVSVIGHLCLTSLPLVRRLASVVAAHLKDKPVAALGLVDPILQQSCAGEIVMRAAQRVGASHLLGNQPVVTQQRRQHLAPGQVRWGAVADRVQAANLADRPDRGAAYRSHALANLVDCTKDLA